MTLLEFIGWCMVAGTLLTTAYIVWIVWSTRRGRTDEE
jgi:hypothetical protein